MRNFLQGVKLRCKSKSESRVWYKTTTCFSLNHTVHELKVNLIHLQACLTLHMWILLHTCTVYLFLKPACKWSSEKLTCTMYLRKIKCLQCSKHFEKVYVYLYRCTVMQNGCLAHACKARRHHQFLPSTVRSQSEVVNNDPVWYIHVYRNIFHTLFNWMSYSIFNSRCQSRRSHRIIIHVHALYDVRFMLSLGNSGRLGKYYGMKGGRIINMLDYIEY